MSSRLKVMKLLLQDGNLEGLLTVEDSSWNGGTLLSCPRDKIDSLLKQDESNWYGVYLLLASNKVYVGQSTMLSHRIKQHILGKDWWERAIILTVKDNSFTKSDIDYLEGVLIDKAVNCGTFDTDNQKSGNPQKVDKFRKAELDEYIDEALFILQLIGVNVFSKIKKKNQNFIPTIPTSSDEEIEIRGKGEVIKYLQSKGIKFTGKYVSYAKRQEKKTTFWNNAKADEISKPWILILNNQIDKEIIVLSFPANAFDVTQDTNPVKGKVCRRKDKAYYMDLNIDSGTFVDKKSDLDFSKYISHRIKY